MNVAIATPVGHPPVLGNLYSLFSAALTIIIPLAILVAIIWYFKQNHYYQTAKLKMMNQILCLLEEKHFENNL